MSILVDIAWYLLAIILSCYHAYRGFMVQWIYANQQNQQLPAEVTRKWSKKEIIVIRCVEDAIFHFICSVFGFLSLSISSCLYESWICAKELDSGKSLLLIFCFLFGIIGISGQLPPLIQLGKFPKGN